MHIYTKDEVCMTCMANEKHKNVCHLQAISQTD